jgi:pimeloyl-ACP methyl ester carboxylesterase
MRVAGERAVADHGGYGPRSSEPRPPSLGLGLTEGIRGTLRMGALPLAMPWLSLAPRGQAHGALVLPGLLAGDPSTHLMRRYLRHLGHLAWGWRLGRNIGPSNAILDGMVDVLRTLADRTGQPVSVIGWSLGGIYARELARRHPEEIRQIITLGSPFNMVDARQSRADPVFQRRAHLYDASRVPSREQVAQPIPVPSTAVYSRRDGIVAWQTCIEPASALHENVEVRCSHLGFGVDPATLWLLADRLAQPQQPEQRQPFRPPALLRHLYPAHPRR